MPVNIVENWCEVSGIILDIKPPLEIGGFNKIDIQVEGVEIVEEYPCFFEDSMGEVIAVYFPEELVMSMPLEVGMWIKCRVRKAGLEKIFVHREHITARFPEDKEKN